MHVALAWDVNHFSALWNRYIQALSSRARVLGGSFPQSLNLSLVSRPTLSYNLDFFVLPIAFTRLLTQSHFARLHPMRVDFLSVAPHRRPN